MILSLEHRYLLPFARRGDYEVRRVPHAEALACVRRWHYAGNASRTSVYAFGLFRRALFSIGAVLVGAALWMPPIRQCALSVAPKDPNGVLALSRLVVAPGEPRGAASIFLGACIREIRREGRFRALVTFADEGQGHTGHIYRVTNWTPAGRAPSAVWMREGVQVSKKATRNRSSAELRAQGCVRTVTWKRRFIMRWDT